MKDGIEEPVWRIEEWKGKSLAGEVETLQRLVVVQHKGALRGQRARPLSLM